MIEPDTIRLLRECDAGVSMGVESIDEVLPYVQNTELKDALSQCKDKHEELKAKLQNLLGRYHDDGKEPTLIAKGMSWMKTKVKLTFDTSDATITELMTDGCNMGVKTLNQYLNQYKAADEQSKDIAKKLIKLEEDLEKDMQKFL